MLSCVSFHVLNGYSAVFSLSLVSVTAVIGANAVSPVGDHQGPCQLVLSQKSITVSVSAENGTRDLGTWPFDCIRRFHSQDQCYFSFTSGRYGTKLLLQFTTTRWCFFCHPNLCIALRSLLEGVVWFNALQLFYTCSLSLVMHVHVHSNNVLHLGISLEFICKGGIISFKCLIIPVYVPVCASIGVLAYAAPERIAIVVP